MKLLLLSTSAAWRAALMLALAGVTAAPVMVWQAQQGDAGGIIGGMGTVAAITGTGSSNGNGKGGGNNGNGGGNGGGPVTPPAKTFQISGAVNDLAPTVTRELVLSVTNPNGQAIRVTSLSASVASITPTGACSPTSLLQVGAWTGSAFNVLAGETRTITGHIPLTLSNAAGDGCQGATFTLNYTGSAAQL